MRIRKEIINLQHGKAAIIRETKSRLKYNTQQYESNSKAAVH